jgi:hypothetical protein
MKLNINIWYKKFKEFFLFQHSNDVYLIKLDQFYYQLGTTILYSQFMDSLFHKSILRSLIMFVITLSTEDLFQTIFGLIYFIVLSFTIYFIWNYDCKNIKILVIIHLFLLISYMINGSFLIFYLKQSPVDFSALVLTRDTYCEFILFFIRCLTLIFSITILISLIKTLSRNSIFMIKLNDEIQTKNLTLS